MFQEDLFPGTNLGLELLRGESINNASFVVSPFFLLFALVQVTTPFPPAFRRVWRGSEISYLTQYMNTVNMEEIKFSAAAHQKWIFDEKLNATIRNPFTTEMAVNFYNEILANQTKGLLNGFLKPNDLEDSAVIRFTAGNFSRKWKTQFDPSKTFKGSFHTSDDEKRSVEYLSMNGEFVSYSENEQFQMLSIPFESDNSYLYDYSMIILLPKNRFGLKEALKTLHYEALDDLFLDASNTSVKATIPKFSVVTDIDCVKYSKKWKLGGLDYVSAKNEEKDREEWDKYYQYQYSHEIGDEVPYVPSPSSPEKVRSVMSIGMNEYGSNIEDTPETLVDMAFSKSHHHPKDHTKQKKFVADHPFVFILTNEKNPLMVGAHF